MFVADTGMSFFSDGPVSMPNMPNQIINRMQVPQGMFVFFVFWKASQIQKIYIQKNSERMLIH